MTQKMKIVESPEPQKIRTQSFGFAQWRVVVARGTPLHAGKEATGWINTRGWKEDTLYSCYYYCYYSHYTTQTERAHDNPPRFIEVMRISGLVQQSHFASIIHLNSSWLHILGPFGGLLGSSSGLSHLQLHFFSSSSCSSVSVVT